MLVAVQGDRVAVHQNGDHGDQRVLCVAIALVLGVNLKRRMLVIYVAVFGNDVSAVSHEGVVISVERAVMGVAHNQAGPHRGRCILGTAAATQY